LGHSSHNNAQPNPVLTHGVEKPRPNPPTTQPEFDPKTAMDHLSQGIRVISKDYFVLYVNRAFSELSGVKPEQAIGKKCWEVFESPLCHTPECRLNKILTGNKMVQTEIERTKGDGSRVPCLLTAFPLTETDGEIIGIMESLRDITEKKELLAKATELEERYKAVIELGTEAGEAIIMLQDVDGREAVQTFVSDQWSIITGYSKQELTGMSFIDLLHPKDKTASLERHRRKLAGETIPGLFEAQIIRKDGSYAEVELTGAFTKYQGSNANVVFLRDVGNRKNLEKALKDERDKYRTLFDDAPITLWELDYSEIKKHFDSLRKQGVTDFREHFLACPQDFIKAVQISKTVRINKAHHDLWETDFILNEQERFEQRKQQFYKTDSDNYRALLDDFVRLAEGQTTFTKEETILTDRDNTRHILTRFTIAPGHEDTWSRVFASLTDITDRKIAEQKLRHHQEHLQDLVEERTAQLRLEVEQRKHTEEELKLKCEGETRLRHQVEDQMAQRVQFTRALVHELKTPLTPLLAANEYLAQSLEGTAKEFAVAANRSACRLERRINELLDLSKGEVGLLELKPSQFNPLKMLEAIIEDTRPLVEKNCQTVTLKTSELPQSIRGDEDRLHQVLLNLIDNAIKFNPKEGMIRVGAKTSGDMLVIDVADDGPGIEPDELAVLFEPYKRSQRKHKGQGGLGIGLALSKMLIELHGGVIKAESNSKSGCKITFSIPAKT
jgi:PAS domain S-box-containing protein